LAIRHFRRHSTENSAKLFLKNLSVEGEMKCQSTSTSKPAPKSQIRSGQNPSVLQGNEVQDKTTFTRQRVFAAVRPPEQTMDERILFGLRDRHS